ncbi:MAG: sigma-54 interaction domain-containing protein [Thermodesulfobacteriota bacterium]
MLLRLVLAIKNKSLEVFLTERFAQPDVRVESVGNCANPFQKAVKTSGDIFVLNTKLMPKPPESAIALINDLPENPTTIVLHNSDSPEEHANLVAWGADVVLFAGLPRKTLAEAIETTLESRRQLVQKSWLDRRTDSQPKLSTFVSDCPQMQIFMDMVKKVIPCNAPVLILGETGVGKEHLAKVIHAEGPRSTGPFLPVNCAALPEALLESELFGHEEGAFTGAVRPRRGAFELAHGGTIFLDEIGDLPLHLQAKLLRVLQEYEVRPVGSEKATWVDIRVIAATNRNLEEEIEKGLFRRDLYYRLGVITLTVPPLRSRREDIPILVDQYLERLCIKMNRESNQISQEALEKLMHYEWPGNVRELINVIERAVILCHGDTITAKDLPQGIHAQNGKISFLDSISETVHPEWRYKSLPEVRDEIIDLVEHAYLKMVLAETNGHLNKAALKAGIHPRGLYEKMKKFGLSKEDYRLAGKAASAS